MARKTKKNAPPPVVSTPEILTVFKNRKEDPITFTEIAQALEVVPEKRKELRRLLRALEDEHKVIKTDRRHYALRPSGKVVTGRVQAHRDGYGFLIPDDVAHPDIFISRREFRDLMDRDRVALHIGKKEKGQKRAPQTIEVLERAHRRIVGRLRRGEQCDFVVPDDPRLVREIRIPRKAAGEGREGQIVLAEIVRYPALQEGPEGRILRILGDADDPRIDAEIVIHKYDLADPFPPPVLKEAAAVPKEISAKEISSREDLRDLNFFTVDGETARDFDDAVAVSRQAGRFQLWVSIADVSHYVAEGSALDLEAQARGTSVYFPERALPMLPPRLSTGICSLNPAENRLAMTVEMEFDGRGRMASARFYPSVIRSRQRLTYTMVKEMVQENSRELIARYPEVYEDLRVMAELCGALRTVRLERGSLDFDLPEPQVVLDVQGRTEEILRAERHIGHHMIEEFMLAANEAVASFLAQKEVPFLHRAHDLPDEKKLEAFKEFVAHLGYRFSLKGKSPAKAFQKLLGQVRGKPEEKSVNYLLLRSMKQARYAAESSGHFALAAPHYLHFTSPIRRYPDLVVHRILKEVLQAGDLTPKRRQRWEKRLPEIAVHSSQRERVAMEAEREIIDRKKVQFMRGKIGQEFNGYISGVVPFGFFVEIEDFFVEGLVHLTRLPEDHYEFIESRHTLLGEHTKRTFRLGDRVRVRVDAANLDRRQVDFGLLS